MTTYATRSPLQPLLNPYMMSELRRSSRRISAGLAQKEDPSIRNGAQAEKEREKSGPTSGSIAKPEKKNVNGNGSKTAAQRGKRKLDYDEEDDGFSFARTRSKKAKAEMAKAPEAIEEELPEKVSHPRGKRSTKKSPKPVDNSASFKENEPVEKRRRSPRHSRDLVEPEPQPLQVKKRRQKESKSREGKERETQPSSKALVQKAPKPSEHIEISFDATKIALPFADTPIIRRNKEMRKGVENGHRRSSLGNRGRRASSLIDSGKSNALPHDEVESTDFYKHIESSLPEPRRMKQLLTWCGTRALIEKPSSTSETYHAEFAAREIQQQLLKEFSIRSEMSDWFDRRDTTPPPQAPKPNPKNISNLAKIENLEKQIARLQLERQTWESLLRAPSKPNASIMPPPSETTSTIPSPTKLSSPSQVAPLRDTVQPHDDSSSHKPLESSSSSSLASLDTAISKRLAKATETLEYAIDKYADNVHLLGSYINGGDQVGDRVLAISANVLEERDRTELEKIGDGDGDGDDGEDANGDGEGGAGVGASVDVRDALRGLSRIIKR